MVKRQRIFLVALLLALALFFNIERLDFEQENYVDINSFSYVLITLAVASVLVIPSRFKITFTQQVLTWLTLYFVLKLVVFHQKPLFGGVHTYVSVTEVGFLVLVIFLARRTVDAIGEFEEAIEAITLSGAGRPISTLEEATDEVRNAVLLSRRHGHPLSVVVIEPDGESTEARLNHSVQEVQRSMMDRYVVQRLATVIGNKVRRTDLLLEQRDKGRFIVLCPETDAPGAKKLGEGLRTAAENELEIATSFGIACFPQQAITFEELVGHAESSLESKSSPARLEDPRKVS